MVITTDKKAIFTHINAEWASALYTKKLGKPLGLLNKAGRTKLVRDMLAEIKPYSDSRRSEN